MRFILSSPCVLHDSPISSSLIQWASRHLVKVTYSSSSIGTATLVGFGLLNYRWVFSAGRFLQIAVASGTSNPHNLEDQWFKTFQLPPPGVPHVWNDASEPPAAEGETMGEKLPRILPKWRLPRHFWILLRAVNLRQWDRRLYFPSEGRRAKEFFARKNPTASTGFEPANLGTKGQHAQLH